MACASSCLTQNHGSYGECLRSKNVQLDVAVPGLGYDPARNKAWDRELDAYRDARRQGIQPDSTKMESVDRAVKISETTGMAYDAGGGQ